MKSKRNEIEINKLEPSTLSNRAITGWYVMTGQLTLFRKRHSSLLSAVDLALPMLVLTIPAMAVLMFGWFFGSLPMDRFMLGICVFSGLSITAVVVAKGSISYEMGGCGSETD